MSLTHYIRGFYLLLILALAACGGGGGSDPSVTTVPGTPTGVMATSGDQSASVTWVTVSGATSYNIYWSFTPGTGTAGTRVSVSTPVFNHGSLTNGTPYYYVVTAVNSAGESSASVEVSATPMIVVIPGTPTGVAASAGFGSATIVWDATSGATSYNIYWSFTLGTGTGGTQVSVSNPVFHHSPLTNGTPYYYVVTAVNSAGESPASLEVSATPVVTASGLPFNDINLENCVNANIVTTPAALTSLECFSLDISDITGIEALTGLTYLHLGTNSIADISPLAALTNLNNLVLFSNTIVDISPLAGLTGLTILRAGVNSITDISSLLNLTGLTTLTLEFNSISDISVLSNFSVLTHLDMRSNNITSLSALSLLTTLTTLVLDDNSISDIGPLAGLINMNILNLGGNGITDIGALLNLTAVTSLSLYSNTISDITVLSNLSVLSGLNLFQNNISDASPLSSLTSLTSVNIAFNNISDVSDFSTLTNLISLDIRSNGIGGQGVGNVDSLVTLTSATQIFLLGNTAISCAELTTLIGVLGSPPVDTDSNLTNTDVATPGLNCANP